MICNKCKTDGIKSSALGKEFYYCRNCKEEIQLDLISSEMQSEPDWDAVEVSSTLTQDETDSLFDQLTRGIP